jgi:DNA-binding transcriptional LysR family regulator
MAKTTTPSWDLYRSYLAVLREGSLSGAARSLGLTQPTIGRHVEALEQALKLPLFTRSLHGLAATEAALALRADAEAMEAAAAALRRSASGQGEALRGTVRLTASEIVGAEVLPPILAQFQAQHPGVTVELALSNRVEDLLRRESDIAVRMVRPTQGALVARRIGEVGLGLYAHPQYLERRGTPATLAELERHQLIGFDRESAFIREMQARGFPLGRGMFSLRTDSDLAQLASLRAGCGIGVCQLPLGARSGLVRLLPGALDWKLPVWLAMHGDLRANRRCRLLFDALGRGLGEYLGVAGR